MRCWLLHGGAHLEPVAAPVELRDPKLKYSMETRILSVSDTAERDGILHCGSGTDYYKVAFLLCRTSALDRVGRRDAPSFPSVAASSRAQLSCESRDKSQAKPAVCNAGSTRCTCRDIRRTFQDFHDAAECSAALNTAGILHAVCPVGGVRINMRNTCPRSPSEPGAL